jgi:hypothetical protein
LLSFVGESNVSGELDAGDESIINQRFYEFSLNSEDYFLSLKATWDFIKTEVYHFQVSPTFTVEIPSGFYVMVSDEYGSVDWILVDEIIGRPLQVAMLDTKFSAWSLRDLHHVDHIEEEGIFFPNTKNPIPITDENNSSCIIISKVDNWGRTKDLLIDTFTV